MVGFPALSRENEDLYRRYSELAVKITRSPPTDMREVDEFMAQKEEIEVDEKQRLQVIDAIAYNDEIRFHHIDKSYYRMVRWYQHLFCHFFTLPPYEFETIGSDSK